jgi:hypothetical protein
MGRKEYDFEQILKYCDKQGKSIFQLTDEEINRFKVN